MTLRKLIAFTLAETLIVMGVIGIVSALTLPNLNSSTGEKEKIARAKKIYSDLNDALGRATAVYGPINEWFINDGSDVKAQNKRFAERLFEFMKISKDCGSGLTTLTQSCVNSGFIHLPVSNYEADTRLDTEKGYTFMTADGTSVSIQLKGTYGNSSMSDMILVDTDGPNKGKKTAGVDVFVFYIDRDNNSVKVSPSTVSNMLTTGYGEGASAWVINYDNMEFLKTDTSGKCKNNSSLTLNASNGTISCK